MTTSTPTTRKRGRPRGRVAEQVVHDSTIFGFDRNGYVIHPQATCCRTVAPNVLFTINGLAARDSEAAGWVFGVSPHGSDGRDPFALTAEDFVDAGLWMIVPGANDPAPAR